MNIKNSKGSPPSWMAIWILILCPLYSVAQSGAEKTAVLGLPAIGIRDGLRSLPGLVLTVPGNQIMDKFLILAAAALANYTTVQLPPFKYMNPLVSVIVPSSSITGLPTFHRYGDTYANLQPLGKSTVEFSVGWTYITGVFNVELYYFQPWVLLKGQKGVVTISFSNITSTQAFTYDALTSFFASMDHLSIGLGQASVEITGFGPLATTMASVVTAFVNENKDAFLGVVSNVSKGLLNACIDGMHEILLPSIP